MKLATTSLVYGQGGSSFSDDLPFYQPSLVFPHYQRKKTSSGVGVRMYLGTFFSAHAMSFQKERPSSFVKIVRDEWSGRGKPYSLGNCDEKRASVNVKEARVPA